jgi:LmbE family N-acetylglucosaminyl deacetylase
MSNRRILAVYAHPDDEGQATGALAGFIRAGDAVTLVCATRGEVGEISHPSLATSENLWYVRELELRAAMGQIGLSDVRFLPYRDSGMAGTPENEDERSLHMQPADTVVSELVAIIRDVRPHLVFTWDPSGGYGHPDHLAVHRHTVAAFDAAPDPVAFSGGGDPWSPERLYWGARTMKTFATMFLELEQRGLLPEPIDPARRERFDRAMTEPDPPCSVVYDAGPFAPLKRQAAGMHRSQFGENSLFARIPEELRQRFYGEERYYQARPSWPEGAQPVRGFDSLRMD